LEIDRQSVAMGKCTDLVTGTPEALPEWSVTIQHFATTPSPRHLKLDVIHDARFRGARPVFVCGNQAIHGRQQKSPFGFAQKTMCLPDPQIPQQRGSFSCQRRT